MSEVVTQALQTNTTPTQTDAAQQTEVAKPQSAKKEFNSKAEEVLWRINEPSQEETQDNISVDSIIEKAQDSASKGSKEANAVQEEPKLEVQKKQKYKIGNDEVELDDDQARRFVQKGMLFEKKNYEVAKLQKELQTREHYLTQLQQQMEAAFNNFQDPSIAIQKLVEKHGEEGVRKQLEGWLRPRIEREMMPPEERRVLDAEERAQRAEALYQERLKQDEAREFQQKSEQYKQNYEKFLLDTLQKGNFPQGTDLTPFVKDMVDWMQRGIEKNIEYTPEQLVNLVKEDNILRVGAVTHTYVTAIEQARKANDNDSVIKYGEQLVETLGEPVMYAIAKYHLAKTRNRQPMAPKPVFDTPKVDRPSSQARRMTEDEYRMERMRRAQAIDRGELVPEWDD